MLEALLCTTVAAGGSVGFLHPLAPEAAHAFWRDSLDAAARGARVVLGAFDGATLRGTVTLLLDLPPNQPHRGEIAKLMTDPAHRGRGIGARLVRAAEAIARARGRTRLVLDTASIDGASSFYERLGWRFAGEIPDYALTPDGRLTGTRLYYRRLDDPGDRPPG